MKDPLRTPRLIIQGLLQEHHSTLDVGSQVHAEVQGWGWATYTKEQFLACSFVRFRIVESRFRLFCPRLRGSDSL